ncbi:MAG TPA: response regulator transcription factor [candidate division Zixibacteria bacterium]|nr:response regulator transcription factor [candidate division Zixibacteria bacterium]
MKDLVRVVLVDDHEIVRLGLMTLLDDVTWVEIVAEVGTADEALLAAEEHRPDVVVMDIRMPGDSGILACEKIVARWPGIKVIMLTSFDDDALVIKALQAGASGYVLKQVGNQSLINAMDAVRQGKAMLDPSVTLGLIDHIRQQKLESHGSAFRDLTSRDMMILGEVALGKTNIQIAKSLNISEKTARNHVSAILTKLGVSNRIEAATFAVRHNIEQYLPEY